MPQATHHTNPPPAAILLPLLPLQHQGAHLYPRSRRVREIAVFTEESAARGYLAEQRDSGRDAALHWRSARVEGVLFRMPIVVVRRRRAARSGR